MFTILVSFIVLLSLIALRIPIAISLILVGFVGILYTHGSIVAVGILKAIPMDFSASWSLSSLPMYLLMGYFAFYAGMAERIFNVVRSLMGKLRGSLAIATVCGCAIFGAISGSSGATAAAFGRLAIPEMDKDGYDKGLSAGSIAASGTLGSLMPPSILMIIYGVLTTQSIGKIFMAGIIPCILSAFIYCIMIYIRLKKQPSLAPMASQKTYDMSISNKFKLILKLWDLIIVIIIVFGGIYSGLMTATEAGACGAACVLIISILRRALGINNIKNSFLETLIVTSTVLFIAVGANIYTRFLALCGLSDFLVTWVQTANLAPAHFVLISFVLFFILGMFLDPIGCMLLTVPILLPMLEAANVDLIWFGILVIKNMEIALITPPVGLNVYIIKGVTGPEMSLEKLFKGISWFVIADIITLLLLFAFPQISLWLPSQIYD